MVTDTQIANRFWAAMEEIYGKAWVKQFGDKPTQIWTRKLYELGMEKIASGIDYLIDNNYKFPPSLPEFTKVCNIKRPAYHSNVVALTEKRTPEQKNNGLKHIKNIKNIIQTLEKG